MDRTRQIVIAAVIAGVVAAATYAVWPKSQRGEIHIPPIGSKR